MLRGQRQAIEIGREAFRLGAWRHRVGAHEPQLSTERCAEPGFLSRGNLVYNTVVLGQVCRAPFSTYGWWSRAALRWRFHLMRKFVAIFSPYGVYHSQLMGSRSS
jgi:hypothetical protein